MLYKPFGKTGLKVSNLGFGAMRLPGHESRNIDLEKGSELLHYGIDQGINYIDTAHGYGDGTSEQAVGKAIKGYEREKLVVTTKIPVDSEENAQPDVWLKKLELTMKRLDTPYIDNLLFHGLRWNVFDQVLRKPGLALDAARKAQAEGLVHHIGFSSHDDTENVIRLIETNEFEMVLLQYNYLDLHNEPAFVCAAAHEIGVVVMGPVAGGRLSLPDAIVIDEDGLLEMKTPEVALRFVWNNPNVHVALSGMNTKEQIDENVRAANRLDRMDEHETALVHQLFERNLKLADLYCTGCGYCMPCPNDVNIPENFRYMNWFRVWGMEEDAKKAYAQLGADHWGPWLGKITGLKAEACAECGECLPKCPQNIQIIDQLKDVADTLKS